MNEVSSDEQDRMDMQRLAGGHDAALNELMERHGQRLFCYLLRQLQNETEAEDFAQETFVRVYLNREKFRNESKFSTWLYAIATNLVRDLFRKRQRHPHVSIDADTNEQGSLLEKLSDPIGDPADGLAASETAEAVRQAIQDLPEDLRTPLILAEYENMAQAEIAKILGCSVKAVEMRIYRARNQLRSVLVKALPIC